MGSRQLRECDCGSTEVELQANYPSRVRRPLADDARGRFAVQTTIDELPVRIAALGAEQVDAVLALWVAPVVSTFPVTSDLQAQKLELLGSPTPQFLTESSEVDGTLADLASFSPDVIFAPRELSGIDGNVALIREGPGFIPLDTTTIEHNPAPGAIGAGLNRRKGPVDGKRRRALRGLWELNAS